MYKYRLLRTFISAFFLIVCLIYYIFIRNIWTSSFLFMSHSIAQSAIGSLLFFSLVFLFLKPSISISDNIAKNIQFRKDNEISTLQEDLIIKVINTSFFRAVELTVCIYDVTYISDSGTHFRYELIHKFLPNKIGPPFLLGWIEGSRSYEKAHALQVRLNKEAENPQMILDALTNPRAHFLVTVQVKNAFSGITSTFTKKYDNEQCMIKGKFYSGNSFDIIKEY